MAYSQYKSAGEAITSSFGGLNRTYSASAGEWSDCENLSPDKFPCISPRKKHGAELELGINGEICAVAEYIEDSGEWSGFTGVILSDECILSDGATTAKNFAFVYNGEIKRVGAESDDEDYSDRTALWIYDTDADEVSTDEVAEFEADMSRVQWTVAAVGKRYIINGYDPALKRGKYLVYDTQKKYDSLGNEKERLVVPSDTQGVYSNLVFRRGTPDAATDEDTKMNYIVNTDESNKLSDRFTEGDYILIKTTKGNGANDTHPYTKDASLIKYAVVQSIEDRYYSDGSWEKEYLLYYTTTPSGKFVKAKEFTDSQTTLGTFIPPMSHITVFGQRVWGVDPAEDAVYASVFDTPFKVMNTDSELDNSMSWQAVIGTPDRAVGVIGALSEVLVMKKNSIVRINGTSASSFMMTGILKNCGCIDINSCAEALGVVYYLGTNGFYAYDGSWPKLISKKLAAKYSSATATSDGVKYYASAVRADTGEHEFLVYDISSGYWLKWSNTPKAMGFIRIADSVCEAWNDSGGHVMSLASGDEAEEWMCESVRHFEDICGFKGVNELRIVCETENALRFFTSVNGDEFTEHKNLEPKGRIFTYIVPVRFRQNDFWQYKIQGTGNCTILSIERIYKENGGRHYVH